MNQNKPHIHAELIKAWADGAEIELYVASESKWRSTSSPFWEKSCLYRIKPIPSVPDSINWDHVHPDFKYMARDENNLPYLYEEKPLLEYDSLGWSEGGWVVKADAFVSYSQGTVDWKDSLVTRPEKGI